MNLLVGNPYRDAPNESHTRLSLFFKTSSLPPGKMIMNTILSFSLFYKN